MGTNQRKKKSKFFLFLTFIIHTFYINFFYSTFRGRIVNNNNNNKKSSSSSSSKLANSNNDTYTNRQSFIENGKDEFIFIFVCVQQINQIKKKKDIKINIYLFYKYIDRQADRQTNRQQTFMYTLLQSVVLHKICCKKLCVCVRVCVSGKREKILLLSVYAMSSFRGLLLLLLSLCCYCCRERCRCFCYCCYLVCEQYSIFIFFLFPSFFSLCLSTIQV